MADEMDTTYGMVVESDEILSPRNGRWFEVISVALNGGRVIVRAKGVKNLITKAPSDPVRVRRGATGKVVDMFAILFSGPTMTMKGEGEDAPADET